MFGHMFGPPTFFSLGGIGFFNSRDQGNKIRMSREPPGYILICAVSLSWKLSSLTHPQVPQ